MMIASSGDEAFMIVAMVPDKALMIFALLFLIAVVCGFLTDFVADRIRPGKNGAEAALTDDIRCKQDFEIHEDVEKKRTFTWKRAVMFIGVLVFIAALVSGVLDHGHGTGIQWRDPARREIAIRVWRGYRTQDYRYVA